MAKQKRYNENNDNGSEAPKGNGPRRGKAAKRGPLFRFGVILVSMILVFLVLAAIVVFAYNYVTKGYLPNDTVRAIAKEIGSNIKTGGSPIDILQRVPERTNFIILGIDDDGQSSRTDMIMVGCFNSATGKLAIISIPRDTYVVMPEERREILKAQGLWTPSDGVMKVNAPYNYAGGKDLGLEFAVKQVEELLKIKIEYFALVDTEALRYIVDEIIGGVEFNVPQRMYYTDPEENLYIDLQAGLQTLNGEQAEGLLRYRKADELNPQSKSYPMGDLDRVKVQQDFIKALVSQALAKNSIISDTPKYIDMVSRYVKTNVSSTDALRYFSFARGLTAADIETYTLPGEPTTLTVRGKRDSFVMPDNVAVEELVNKIFYASSEDTEAGEQ